jgi:hypothetical protein
LDLPGDDRDLVPGLVGLPGLEVKERPDSEICERTVLNGASLACTAAAWQPRSRRQEPDRQEPDRQDPDTA